MLNSNSEGLSLFRLRWIGYGLLIFSILDSLDTLIPLQLMNHDWIRQTFGALVERTPLLLMGLGLIFNGEAYRRRKMETFFLHLISWGCLLLMVVFALIIPVGLTVSSFVVYNQNQQVVNTRLKENLSQLRQTQEQVGRASDSELKELVAMPSSQVSLPQILMPSPPAVFGNSFSPNSRSEKLRLRSKPPHF
jgi:hypothetical protein